MLGRHDRGHLRGLRDAQPRVRSQRARRREVHQLRGLQVADRHRTAPAGARRQTGPGREREREARKSAALFLKHAKRQKVIVKNFRDGFFPYEGAKVKSFFEELKKEVNPDLIFTHYRIDRHQDHRTISDLTWNTWRRHLILEYEIPKFDGDLGSPNCFVPLSQQICSRKIKYICDVFQTQSNKSWLTEDTFQAMLRLRGVECAQRQAEAFYCRKLILGTQSEAAAGRSAEGRAARKQR